MTAIAWSLGILGTVLGWGAITGENPVAATAALLRGEPDPDQPIRGRRSEPEPGQGAAPVEYPDPAATVSGVGVPVDESPWTGRAPR